MKQFPLVQVGNPAFSKPCTPYTPQEITSKVVRELTMRMKYTMAQVSGVGLAGLQVGLHKQVFVMRLLPTKYRPDIPHVKPYAVFNPVIHSLSQTRQTDWEGCFSVAKAGLFARTERPESIEVTYLDERGEHVQRTLVGLEARIFQHEYDHLQGKVFLEQKVDLTNLMSSEEYRAMRKREFEAIAQPKGNSLR